MSGVGISGLQCGVDVLRQYRVLGVTGATSTCHCRTSNGVIIAQLPHSNHSVAIKVRFLDCCLYSTNESFPLTDNSKNVLSYALWWPLFVECMKKLAALLITSSHLIKDNEY